nr:puromycin resistance protein pur8 [Quercus suber]
MSEDTDMDAAYAKKVLLLQLLAVTDLQVYGSVDVKGRVKPPLDRSASGPGSFEAQSISCDEPSYNPAAFCSSIPEGLQPRIVQLLGSTGKVKIVSWIVVNLCKTVDLAFGLGLRPNRPVISPYSPGSANAFVLACFQTPIDDMMLVHSGPSATPAGTSYTVLFTLARAVTIRSKKCCTLIALLADEGGLTYRPALRSREQFYRRPYTVRIAGPLPTHGTGHVAYRFPDKLNADRMQGCRSCRPYICLVFFVDIANLGMANIALPTIQDALGYDDGSLQWVLTAYSLMYGGFLMTGGRFGDIFGHRNVLLFGLSLFNVATLICALVDDKIGLLVGRALQGLAAAFSIPSAQSLVSLAFEDPQARVRAFAVWGACGSTGFVLIVEGALEIVALALLFTHNLPGEAPTRDGKWKLSQLPIRIDLLGTVLSIPGLVLLVYGLTEGNIDGWSKANVIATIVVAVVLLFAFALVEVKFAPDPILPKYVWGDRTRILGCIIAALTYAVWQGCNYLLTLQLQSLGFSPLGTALRFLPLGITAMVVNFIIPFLLKPVGPRILLLVSWLLTIGGLVLFTRLESEHDYWRYCLPGMILYIAGVGTVYFVGNVSVVATATASTQGTMFLNVGGAVLGVAVLTVINDSVVSDQGGSGNIQAVLAGYRAGYYGAIAMAAIGFILSVFFTQYVQQAASTEQPELAEQSTTQLGKHSSGDVDTEIHGYSGVEDEKATTCIRGDIANIRLLSLQYNRQFLIPDLLLSRPLREIHSAVTDRTPLGQHSQAVVIELFQISEGDYLLAWKCPQQYCGLVPSLASCVSVLLFSIQAQACGYHDNACYGRTTIISLAAEVTILELESRFDLLRGSCP